MASAVTIKVCATTLMHITEHLKTLGPDAGS